MIRTLTSISDDLDRLATGASQGEFALRSLAGRLRRPDCSDMTAVNLSGMYSPAVILADDSSGVRRLANLLELVRDVLIFIPVIYTWWKIAEALTAYNEYKGSAPFLLAWQQGFDNVIEPLSASASVVAGTVLAVVLLTVFAHVVRSGHDRRVQNRQQRLAVLLAEADLMLAQSLAAGATDLSRVDVATIGTRIAASSQALQQALGRSSAEIVSAVNTNPGSKLHEMFANWTAAAHELKDLGTRLQGTQETVQQLHATQTAVSVMAQQIGEETRKLLAALETERSLSRQEAHAHHELAVAVGESTKLLDNSLKGLNERAGQFNELILRLAHIVDLLEGDGPQSSSY